MTGDLYKYLYTSNIWTAYSNVGIHWQEAVKRGDFKGVEQAKYMKNRPKFYNQPLNEQTLTDATKATEVRCYIEKFSLTDPLVKNINS